MILVVVKVSTTNPNYWRRILLCQSSNTLFFPFGIELGIGEGLAPADLPCGLGKLLHYSLLDNE